MTLNHETILSLDSLYPIVTSCPKKGETVALCKARYNGLDWYGVRYYSALGNKYTEFTTILRDALVQYNLIAEAISVKGYIL